MTLRYLAAVALLSLAACQPAATPAMSPPSSALEEEPAANPYAAEQGFTTPKAFMSAIYDYYIKGAPKLDWIDHRSDYFDPEMTELMEEDARLNKEEVGALDGDPFCDCQDFGNLTAMVTVDSATPTEAKATVVVTETDPGVRPEDRKPRTFTYDLKRVNGQWRIHDMTTPSIPSLRRLFITSNKAAADTAAAS